MTTDMPRCAPRKHVFPKDHDCFCKICGKYRTSDDDPDKYADLIDELELIMEIYSSTKERYGALGAINELLKKAKP
jgi:Cdc6-like AAA superfamily ATPase